MVDQPATTSPNFDIRSPTITINEGSREGVVNIMFHLDTKLLDWIANQFYSSHVEQTISGEHSKLEIIPNSTYYKCPKCGSIKSRDTSIGKAYLSCSGTSERKHRAVSTAPQDFHPILKKEGLYYLLGNINSALNANIATGNVSAGESDLKKNMSLEDRLRYKAWYLAYSTLAVLVGQYNIYVSEDIIKNKKLASVFNIGFCTNFIISMADNIIANSTKGKNMAAASKVMDTKISTENTSSTRLDYQYPQSGFQQQKKGVGDRIADIFKF